MKCLICDVEITFDEVSQYAAYGGLPSPCCNICFQVNDYSIKSIDELKIKSLKRRMESNQFNPQQKTGVELIADERGEQLSKHGRTIEKDVLENKDNQLVYGAEALISKDWSYGFDNEEDGNQCPANWDYDIWMKMYNKSYKKRLIIAGALIAAEIDRIIETEKDRV